MYSFILVSITIISLIVTMWADREELYTRNIKYKKLLCVLKVFWFCVSMLSLFVGLVINF